jgi:hypothetical protein
MLILIQGMQSIDSFLKREPVLKADVKLANKYINKCSMSLAIEENTNETTCAFHLSSETMHIARKNRNLGNVS